jgi:uncharacterized protein YdeI (BOF family)
MMSESEKGTYIRKLIKDISPQDNRVQVVGKIQEKIADNKFKISDGTGTVTVIFKNQDLIIDKIREKMIIKVLGDLKSDAGDVIDVKYAKDYTDINLEVYKKTLEYEKKYLE